MDAIRDPKVSCLTSICDIHRICDDEGLKLSPDSNRFLLKLTLNKLGHSVSQKLVQELVNKGVIEWKKDELYEVESILDHVNEDGIDLYLVKWKGWMHKYNTWEPKEHLNCDYLVKRYHWQLEHPDHIFKRPFSQQEDSSHQHKRHRMEDVINCIISIPDMTPSKLLEYLPKSKVKCFSSRTHADTHVLRKQNIFNKRTKSYKQLHQEVMSALKAWEKQINAINKDPAPITVENNVDLEGPPASFTYINDYMPMPGIVIPNDPIIGCECSDCFSEKKTCCASSMSSEFAYYKHKRIRVPPGTPVYECNKCCKCGPECPNRVVQHGRRHAVCLFRTSNGRGWGVKAMQKVKKGSFVMEYVGEVITNEEAERRGKIYDAEGRTYLFDLDYNGPDCPYTVDAGFYGNISHFVNHSCDPNLAVYGVWINHLNPQLPRIALFAKRDIMKGEEFTFDYMMTGDTTHGQGEAQNSKTAVDSSLIDNSAVGMMESNDSAAICQNENPVGLLVNGSAACISDSCSDISTVTDTSNSTNLPDMDMPNPFIHRNMISPSPALKYRIRCQCGAANCRKYLF